jgi:hypothetical protein
VASRKRKADRTDDEIIDAIIRAHGIKTQAARIIGCSRSTLDEYIKTRPAVAGAHEEAHQILIDAAESVLFQKALIEKDGQSLRYLLDVKGRERGYGKTEHSVEVSGPGGGLVIYVPDDGSGPVDPA